jgi:hypothetical protein
MVIAVAAYRSGMELDLRDSGVNRGYYLTPSPLPP